MEAKMNITRRQLRRLIQESYRKLHRQQSSGYKSGEVGGVPGPISISPSKKYYEGLRAGLYQKGIDSQKNHSHGSYDYTLSNGHELGVARSISWPHGFTVVRMSLWNASMSQHPFGLAPFGIHFAVTGNPEVDAEFISRLCALSDDVFLRIATKTRGSARVGSWESEIIPGYPHKFIGL